MGKIAIGRIVPNNRGDWSVLAAAEDWIELDDIVEAWGSTWLAIRQHQAVSGEDGTQPSGPYSTVLFLQISGGLDDQNTAEWDVDEWYYMGQVATRGSSNFVCLALNKGKVPEANPAHWMQLSKGVAENQGSFSTAAVYRPGDVVEYKNSVFYCVKTTGGFPPNLGKGLIDFELLRGGLLNRGPLLISSNYDFGEVIKTRGKSTARRVGGSAWVCCMREGVNAGQTPALKPSAWCPISRALDFGPKFQSGVRYYEDDVFDFQGSIYAANQTLGSTDTPTSEPSKFTTLIDLSKHTNYVTVDDSGLPNRVRISLKRS